MLHIRLALIAWNWRHEIGVVFGVLAVMIILPILVIFGLFNNGVQGVSDAFVSVNAITHDVEVRNARGELVGKLKATTSWPIKGTVTQEFGDPNPPYQIAHTGIDIDGGFGAPITAFMEGKVVGVGDLMAGCGICVKVEHAYNITSYYAHLSKANTAVGREVKPGDIIGFEGETGWADGAHLHFEVRVMNLPVNPRPFMVGNPAPRG